MKIYKYQSIKDWYICVGFVGRRRVFGAGRNHYEALVDAMKS